MSRTDHGVTSTYARSTNSRDGVALARLLWLAPLTVVAALGLNLLIRYLAQALDPSLREVGRLGMPLISLTLQGAVAAVIVFAVMAYFVRRPIFWYRIVATVAVLLSLSRRRAAVIRGSE